LESNFTFTFTELLTDTAANIPHDTRAGMFRYSPVPGDLNSDARVNINDLFIVASAYGKSPGDEKWNPVADINADEIINILDLIHVARNYGRTG
jgi:hypothetical protein